MKQTGESANEEAQRQSRPAGTGAGAQKARVLLIEDSEDIRYLLASVLGAQYTVVSAEAGAQGLLLAAAEPRPDIVLLDVMMPDMDGYEVLTRLARDPRTADIPVIFLTALGSVDEEQRGLDLGAIDYVAKPISPPILLARIRLHLERSTNARRLKDLSEQLSRYLAPQVYQSLFDGTRQAEIRTQRKKLTVFFSDIRNFTESTAQWQPEEVTLLLNSYFAEMSQIAAEYGATLDKFIGDAIVIFFGDPNTLGVRQDALQCVKMAVAMQKRMDELQVHWREIGINKTFQIRIGINSGFCDVGNFGSKLRMEYTIIGREVNLAARLEQAAQAGEILISSETHALVQQDIRTEAREPLMAKGFAQPIAVYAVRPESAGSDGQTGVLRCDRPGLQVAIDTARLTPLQRLEAADELRAMVRALEQPAAAAPTAQVSPEPSVPAPPLRIAGLDTELGLRRAMGMQGLYLSMLNRFLEGRRDTGEKIRAALVGGDTHTAELLTHSLRGVAAQIGAIQVPLDAGALEQAIHEAQPADVIDGLLGVLQHSLAQLLQALQEGLPEGTVAT